MHKEYSINVLSVRCIHIFTLTGIMIVYVLLTRGRAGSERQGGRWRDMSDDII